MQTDALPWIWQRLKEEKRPIALYGMGDGADKALAVCAQMGIQARAVFASDAFVRGQSYAGYPVLTFAQAQEALGDFVALLCFATERPEVLENIEEIARRQTLLVPDFPVCGEELFSPDFCRAHQEELAAAHRLLADDFSRMVFEDLVVGKITGRLRVLRRHETQRAAVGELLPLGEGAFFVDAGAYTGDTVEEFVLRTNGKFKGVLVVEPDKRNFAKLLKTVERLGIQDRAQCVRACVWSEKGALAFEHRSGRMASLAANGKPGDVTQADSVDNLLAGRPAALLKFDVEGAEREALLGSAQTIRRCRPSLAVAVYHRREDLFALPLLIHSLCPDYRIFLRRHPYLPAWESNLYCTVH